ncbi:MAG: hypothetical protein IPI46_00105 [Bacteroidetes bacterium]|nr:hypothetical protein [Bacteroidota bacterium]
MRIILSCLFLFSMHISMAQNVSITCQFENGSADSGFIQLNQLHIPTYEATYQSAIKNNECNFKFIIPAPCKAELKLGTTSIPLWIEPNDNLNIMMTNGKFEFSGTGSIHNQFLSTFNATFGKDFNKDSVKQNMLRSEIDPFENALYSARKNQIEYFKSANTKQKFSANFAMYITNLIRYQYYYQLIAYPIIRANENQGLSVTPLPEIVIEEITNDLANHDEALNVESYRNFLNYFVIYNTSKLNAFEKFTDLSVSMESKIGFANQALKGQSKIYYIASFLNDNVETVTPITAKKKCITC